MPERTHVYVDVTAAQAGVPSIDVRGGPIENADTVDVATALQIADDLHRAALTAEQLHDEFGDDRDPNHRRVPPFTQTTVAEEAL